MGDKEEKITKEEAQKDEFSLPWSKNKNKDKKVRGLCSKSLPGAEMYFCFLFLFFFFIGGNLQGNAADLCLHLSFENASMFYAYLEALEQCRTRSIR